LSSKIGIRDLRNNLTATIRRVREGESFEVTHHGVPIAVIAPVPPDRIGRLVAAGDVTPGKRVEGAFRRFPVTGGVSASQALEDDRAGG
jgi:prevent-host-death family protein